MPDNPAPETPYDKEYEAHHATYCDKIKEETQLGNGARRIYWEETTWKTGPLTIIEVESTEKIE